MKKNALILLSIITLAALVAGCSQPSAMPAMATLSPAAGTSSFTVSSPVFKAGDRLPAKYTADGADISPPLAWEGAPAGTGSFAIVVDDPDAPGGNFTHWIIFNIAGNATGLPEAVPGQPAYGNAMQGTNDFGNIGYGGPAPPPGSPHHYRFTAYALDGMLSQLRAGASAAELKAAMQGHILAQGTVTALYGH